MAGWPAGYAGAERDPGVNRLRRGNVGDSKSVGDSVSELRIDYGPGYRVYFTRVGVVLLCGGDKSSQTRDIEAAIRLALRFRGEDR
jgi:putative addiction module killer protein